jgi:uncharacterized phiE125 gp8 family phage protein
MTYPSPFSLTRTWPYWPIDGIARRTIGPALEPITLDEARDQAHLDLTDDDALLQAYIVAARSAMEELLSKPLLSQTFELNLSRFPAWELGLPRTGQLGMQDLLTSVTSVAYIDANGNPQTLPTTSYVVDPHHADYARLLPYGIDALTGRQTLPIYWPPTRYIPNAATVTYVTGLANRAGAGGVPEDIRLAMLQVVAMLYENRESAAKASDVVQRLPTFDDLVLTHRSTWEPEWQ